MSTRVKQPYGLEQKQIEFGLDFRGKCSIYRNSWQPGQIGLSLKASSDEQVRQTPVKNNLGRVGPTLREGDGRGDLSRSLSLSFPVAPCIFCTGKSLWGESLVLHQRFTLKLRSWVYLSVCCCFSSSLTNFSWIPTYKSQWWAYGGYLGRQMLKSIHLLIALMGAFHLEQHILIFYIHFKRLLEHLCCITVQDSCCSLVGAHP